VIIPVFTCSAIPGIHEERGGVGEPISEILGRWTSIKFPVRTVTWVQQTSLSTWMAMLDNNETIDFIII